jgi:hypothetical protein
LAKATMASWGSDVTAVHAGRQRMGPSPIC